MRFDKRIIDTPITEMGIAGIAVGAAMVTEKKIGLDSVIIILFSSRLV